jgi:hypothetical protein
MTPGSARVGGAGGFAGAAEALVKAIQEHREGAPENVPYQS